MYSNMRKTKVANKPARSNITKFTPAPIFKRYVTVGWTRQI